MWRAAFDLFQPGIQRGIKRGVVEVPSHVEDALREGGPHFGVERRILQELLHRSQHLLAEIVIAHGRAGDAQHGKTGIQAALVGEPVEGRQQLAFGEIAIGSEDHHGALGNAPLEAQGILERILQRHVFQNSTFRLHGC